MIAILRCCHRDLGDIRRKILAYQTKTFTLGDHILLSSTSFFETRCCALNRGAKLHLTLVHPLHAATKPILISCPLDNMYSTRTGRLGKAHLFYLEALPVGLTGCHLLTACRSSAELLISTDKILGVA
jgi:hypothetical protein